MASTNANQVQGLLVAAGVGVCLLGMLSHPMKIAGKERLRFILDAATTMAATCVVIWYYVLGAAAAGANLTSQVLSATLMLVSTFAVIKLLLGGNAPFTRKAGIVGAVSTALNGIVTATGPLIATPSHPYLGLALRLLTFMALTATPRVQELEVRTDPAAFTRHPRRPYSLLPYAAVAAAQVMLIIAALDGALNARAWGVIVGVVLITCLVVVRQLDAFADNNRLLQQLDLSLLTLRQQENRFRSLVQHASDITALIDVDGRVAYLSPAVEPILGLTPEQAHGKRVHAAVHPDDHAALNRALADLAANPGHSRTCQLRLRRTDGAWRWLGIVATNHLDDPGVTGIVCNVRDMTEALEFQDQLQHQATHDPLTGLANRTLFAERLATAAPNTADFGAVIIVDLDDFKTINDTLGHHVGDALLIMVADRLRSCARSNDTVARLGGDEFALLLPGACTDSGTRIAKRILAALAEPMISDGQPITVKASIGLAAGSLSDAQVVLQAADEAMYTAKRNGKNAYTAVSLNAAA